MPLSCGPATCATTRDDPAWPNRDRFVLSAGHGSMLLYALLHLAGYDLPLDELKRFRQWGSKTPGHPEYGLTPGVETTTGPLGQGFANGVGMAIAAKMAAARYNTAHAHDRRSLHLWHRQRRRPDGGRRLRGGLAGRAPGAGQPHLFLRRQPASASKARPTWPLPRIAASALRPMAGRCSTSTGTTARRPRAPSRQAQADTERPTLIVARTHIA